MTNEQIAEMLKDEIFKVEQSKKYDKPDDRIVIVHLDTEVFLKMAYLFVGTKGK